MSNPSNTSDASNPLITAKWMLPAVREQLQQLHTSLKGELTPQALQRIAHEYQQIQSKLELAGLDNFAGLANQLLEASTLMAHEGLSLSHSGLVLRASELLLQELIFYVDYGTYQDQLVVDYQQQLHQLIHNHKQNIGLVATKALRSDANPSVTEPTYQDSALLDDQVSEASVNLHSTDSTNVNSSTDDCLEKGIVDDKFIDEVLTRFELSNDLIIPEDDSDSELEIKQIFVEEASSVLDDMAINMPKLNIYDSNSNALADIRRGFHTLKGSGRIVGANSSAELASAIENMLNRVMDNTIKPNIGMQHLLQDVLAGYPDLIKAYENHASYPKKMQLWIIAANIYASHQHPEFNYSQLLNSNKQLSASKESNSNQQAHQPNAVSKSAKKYSERLLTPLYDYDSSNTKRYTVTSNGLTYDLNLNSTETSYAINQLDTSLLELAPKLTIGSNVTKFKLPLDFNQPDIDQSELSHPELSQPEIGQPELSQHSDTSGTNQAEENTLSNYSESDAAHMMQLFITEADDLLNHIENILNDVKSKGVSDAQDDLARAFHTLRGAAGSQSIDPIQGISSAIEHYLEYLQRHNLSLSKPFIGRIKDVTASIRAYISLDTNYVRETQYSTSTPAVNEPEIRASKNRIQANLKKLEHEFVSGVDTDAIRDRQGELSLSVAELVEGIDDLIDTEWQLKNKLVAYKETKKGKKRLKAYLETIIQQAQLLLPRVSESKDFVTLLNAFISALKTVREYPKIIVAEQTSSTLKDADSAKDLHSLNVNHPIDILVAGQEQLIELFDALASNMALKVDENVVSNLQAISPPENNNELPIEKIDTDLDMLSVFIEEAQGLDEDSNRQLNIWQNNPTNRKPVQVLQRHLHTLKGGANMSGISSIAELCHEAETLYELILTEQLPATAATIKVMQSVQDILSNQIEVLASDGHSFFVPHMVEQLRTLSTSKSIDKDFKLQMPVYGPDQFGPKQDDNALSNQTNDLNEDSKESTQQPITDDDNLSNIAAHSSKEAETSTLLKNSALSNDDSALVKQPSGNYQDEAHEKIHQSQSNIPSALSPTKVVDREEDVKRTTTTHISKDAKQLENNSAVDAEFEKMKSDSWKDMIPDAQILSIFVDEAEEILARTQHHLSQLNDVFVAQKTDENLENETPQTSIIEKSAFKELQRQFHILKGGANMIYATATAEVADALKTVYKVFENQPNTRLKTEHLQLLEVGQRWLKQAVYLLKHGYNPPSSSVLVTKLQHVSKHPDDLQQISQVSQLDLTDYVQAISRYETWREARLGLRDISEKPPCTLPSDERTEESSNNEVVRVPVKLIDQMINLAGESSISSSRIERSMKGLGSSLNEMDATVRRLSEQLRRMDIELETQIRSQIDDQSLSVKEGFDPLEMDQYSALNQLSKSLAESASDLLDIKTTLQNQVVNSESQLVQLSQSQAQLQKGLMTSRMVPFSSILSRLKRTARHTAQELGKSVELIVNNENDEIDSTILERITSPLEHMIRNAVDHGIELPDYRTQVGKPKTGKITIDVTREGSEIVIRLKDDGQGIDVESVRRQAISNGLLSPNDTILSDLDIVQFIFHAGLSTARHLSQISGRGVGMDVVLNEVRQLGGSVSAHSKSGDGTEFILRLPLTIAVADVLLVRAGEETYGIPLLQIERVERIDTKDLRDFYDNTAKLNDFNGRKVATSVSADFSEQETSHQKVSHQEAFHQEAFHQRTFDIGGAKFKLRHLSEILLGQPLLPSKISQTSPSFNEATVPVVILKSHSYPSFALQVDEIIGSRVEVVVKALSRPLSSIKGLSAATITGDGSVVLILDALDLMRNAYSSVQSSTQLRESSDVVAHLGTAKKEDKGKSSILIVDDSVTVRKVTSRMLQRHGYEVHVARDGVEAVDVLKELSPDLMLLDIEMPVMDGFEVATYVRQSTELKELPIIMITSRSGVKHRNKALELGVNDYMGKPFQEEELINVIDQLINEDVQR